MKNKYLKSKCGYDMQGENQNTEKSRITERVRSWEKYGGWTNLKPKGIQTTLMGVFSLVSITIMLISGFVMYIWFSTLSREETVQSTQKLMEQTGESLEDYLVSMRQVSDTVYYECEDTQDPQWREIYEKRCKKLGFTAYFDYSWQWAYKKKFEDAGITAILGSGFDPGVTSVYSAYALKHYFDEIHYIDILDCNGGDHGYPFATNFNPEINLREVSAMGSYWEDGHWVEVEPMSIKREYDFPEVGEKDMYLLHHEEIESLAKNIPGIKRIRFFMTFGQSYLTHMKCLENVGMLSTTPINFEGKEIVPIQFLKALLPDPASLGPRTVGKTNIGCIFKGVKDGKEKTIYIYNVCDHQECYKEVGSQAISYTTGVPAMIGTMMVVEGLWKKPGVFNVEEFDPDPYMEALNKWGLPWVVCENPQEVE